MSPEDGDADLAEQDERERGTLEAVRRSIVSVAPNAEECISYRHPATRVRGRVVAGFATFKNHLSNLPPSGSVFSVLADELAGRGTPALGSALDEGSGEPVETPIRTAPRLSYRRFTVTTDPSSDARRSR